jgi:NAD(P)-dependent dehydrogenase (short-subunit alcohol dehydrogenase family)
MPNAYNLAGKSVRVTGGAKGIGTVIAELLRASGASVMVWDSTPVEIDGGRARY